MASFNDAYGKDGGFTFESSGSTDNLPQSRPRRQRIRNEEPIQRPRMSSRDITAGLAAHRETYNDGFDDDFTSDGFDDDFDNIGSDMDNYRPGTLTARNQQRAKIAGNDDPFDDDDFGDMPSADMPKGRPVARPARRGYSMYDDDYTDADFQSEFAGIHAIGQKKKPGQSRDQYPDQRRPMGRDPEPRRRTVGFDRDADIDDGYDDADGYYGDPSMRDQPFMGQIPKIFAEYFTDEAMSQQNGGVRNSKNNSANLAARKRRNMLITAATALGAVALAALAIVYFSTLRVSAPLNITTALTSMDSTTSAQLIKASVDGTLSGKSISVSAGKRAGVFYLNQFGFEYSTEPDGTQEYIEVDGPDGKKVKQTITTMNSVKFNETLVREYLYSLVGTDGTRMVEPSFEEKIDQDLETKEYSGKLIVKKGSDGYGVDYDSFIKKVIDVISTDDYSTTVTNELTETIAPPVDIDKIYEQVYSVATDASSTTDGEGNVTYYDHVMGVYFDLEAARKKINAGGDEWTFDLTLTQPAVTVQELRKYDFPDLLATYYTEFNGGNAARSSNLRLAGAKINGLVLEPGDEFSFNGTVGQRTKENGFAKATVYSSEGTDEDYGGGICQTSSTLFYTCILANLEITERHNHLYTVAYMTNTERVQTFANDATVNWGTADFKFKNNKDYPIKIECISKENTITFNIWGTWDGWTADYKYVEDKIIPVPVVYHKAKPGKKNQTGQWGRVIRSYRVIYYEGEEKDRYCEFTSSYNPLSQIYYVNSPPAGKQFDVVYGG